MLPDGCSLASCLLEWSRLKSNISTHERQLFTLTNTNFWLHMIAKYSDPVRYGNILLIIAITLLIVLDTSEAERGFSLANRLQSFTRNRLKNKHLFQLMMICSLSPRGTAGKFDYRSFDIKAVLAKWFEGSKKGRYLDAAFNDLVF
jgi:hypothetical protein